MLKRQDHLFPGPYCPVDRERSVMTRFLIPGRLRGRSSWLVAALLVGDTTNHNTVAVTTTGTCQPIGTWVLG